MEEIKRDWKILERNLIRLIQDRGISVAELARRTGVPKSNISSWLLGAKPDIYQMDKIARFFSTTIENLVFDRHEASKDDLATEKLCGEYRVTITKMRDL